VRADRRRRLPVSRQTGCALHAFGKRLFGHMGATSVPTAGLIRTVSVTAGLIRNGWTYPKRPVHPQRPVVSVTAGRIRFAPGITASGSTWAENVPPSCIWAVPAQMRPVPVQTLQVVLLYYDPGAPLRRAQPRWDTAKARRDVALQPADHATSCSQDAPSAAPQFGHIRPGLAIDSIMCGHVCGRTRWGMPAGGTTAGARRARGSAT
jgi:hypothetical protein